MTIDITWDQALEWLKKVDRPGEYIYGVPKGGMILSAFLRQAYTVHDPEFATTIIDDILDSGKTEAIYKSKFPHTPFFCFWDKRTQEDPQEWVTFPWERDHPAGPDTIQQNITRLIQFIGEKPERAGLKETPDRVVRSYAELFAGYKQDPADVFKTFEEPQIGGMVYLKNIEFFSMCEHHMLPFYGMAHIGYIPKGKVIGISKLARLLDVFARRLQLQERIGEQVTTALMHYLKPEGAACIIEAKHLCIACRGAKKQHSLMGYSSMKGVFLDNPAARMEFIGLIK